MNEPINVCPNQSDIVLVADIMTIADAFMLCGFLLGILAAYIFPRFLDFFFWRLYRYKKWTFLDYKYELRPQFYED